MHKWFRLYALNTFSNDAKKKEKEENHSKSIGNGLRAWAAYIIELVRLNSMWESFYCDKRKKGKCVFTRTCDISPRENLHAPSTKNIKLFRRNPIKSPELLCADRAFVKRAFNCVFVISYGRLLERYGSRQRKKLY